MLVQPLQNFNHSDEPRAKHTHHVGWRPNRAIGVAEHLRRALLAAHRQSLCEQDLVTKRHAPDQTMSDDVLVRVAPFAGGLAARFLERGALVAHGAARRALRKTQHTQHTCKTLEVSIAQEAR